MRSFTRLRIAAFATLFFFLCMSFLSSRAQDCGPITSTQLKQMLVNMGFEVKNINAADKADKFEVKNSAGGLDVPTAYELSSSTNYIWLTVFLGKPPVAGSANNDELLKQNFTIQPAFFYVTDKGNLMMGLPVENRAVTPAVLRRVNDFIINRVADTQKIWGSQ